LFEAIAQAVEKGIVLCYRHGEPRKDRRARVQKEGNSDLVKLAESKWKIMIVAQSANCVARADTTMTKMTVTVAVAAVAV
jgi:hypothetical protein